MSNVNITIDDRPVEARAGEYLMDVARREGIYIPSLCNIPGVKPRGSCRVCTVIIDGRNMTSCTTPVRDGMNIQTNTPELEDLRKAIIESLFVEGNHLCPSCEKSGDCELQGLAYRFSMTVPRFPYQFQHRDVVAVSNNLLKDHNRCILCKRCIRAITDEKGNSVFAFKNRGHKLEIIVDPKYAANMTLEQAQKAREICPVGTLIVPGRGFSVPIGQRKFDHQPIGSDVEQKSKARPGGSNV